MARYVVGAGALDLDDAALGERLRLQLVAQQSAEAEQSGSRAEVRRGRRDDPSAAGPSTRTRQVQARPAAASTSMHVGVEQHVDDGGIALERRRGVLEAVASRPSR